MCFLRWARLLVAMTKEEMETILEKMDSVLLVMQDVLDIILKEAEGANSDSL